MKKRTLFPTSRPFAVRMNRRALPLMMGLFLRNRRMTGLLCNEVLPRGLELPRFSGHPIS